MSASTKAVLSQDLLPCPFCGPGTEIFIEPDERGSGGQWVGPIHVGCAQCKAEQRGDEQAEAISAWNTRASLRAALAEGEAEDMEPDAWLYTVREKKAGRWSVFASIDPNDTSWWPTDGKEMTKAPLYTHPSPAALRAAVIEECAQAVKDRATSDEMFVANAVEAIRALKEKA